MTSSNARQLPHPLDVERRRRRREVLRAYHPDHGGDAATLIRALAELEREGAGRDRPGSGGPEDFAEVRFVRAPRGLARLAVLVRVRRRRGTPRVV